MTGKTDLWLCTVCQTRLLLPTDLLKRQARFVDFGNAPRLDLVDERAERDSALEPFLKGQAISMNHERVQKQRVKRAKRVQRV